MCVFVIIDIVDVFLYQILHIVLVSVRKRKGKKIEEKTKTKTYFMKTIYLKGCMIIHLKNNEQKCEQNSFRSLKDVK